MSPLERMAAWGAARERRRIRAKQRWIVAALRKQYSLELAFELDTSTRAPRKGRGR